MSEIRRLTTKESTTALWLASYAKSVVGQIIATGHPDPDDFVSLCHAIRELEDNILAVFDCDEGACEFAARAEEVSGLPEDQS